MARAIERLAAAQVQRQFALLGRAANAIGILQVVDFPVKFQPFAELVPGDQPTSPAAGHIPVADPAAYFAVQADRSSAGRGFDRQIILRSRLDHAAAHRAGGIVDGGLRIGAQRKGHVFVGLGFPSGVMFVGPPFDAQQGLAQPGARGVVLVSGRGNGQLVFELDAIAPDVIHIDVGHLVVGLGRIMVGDPAQVDFPMPVPGRAGIVGNKWGSPCACARVKLAAGTSRSSSGMSLRIRMSVILRESKS